MAYINSTNNYATSRFIVGPLGQAGYQTIASAIADASSGDTVFILPGTYTENLTMKAGVSLSSYNVGETEISVIILGKTTCNYIGICSCTGIAFKTNGDNAIYSTSGAATLNLTNCSFVCQDTAFLINVNNASFAINCYNCISSGSYALYEISAASKFFFSGCNFSNSGTTPYYGSLSYANTTEFENCNILFPISCNGTGLVIFRNGNWDSSSLNLPCITVNNSTTGVSILTNSSLASGTATGILMGTSTNIKTNYLTFTNSNTYDITGT